MQDIGLENDKTVSNKKYYLDLARHKFCEMRSARLSYSWCMPLVCDVYMFLVRMYSGAAGTGV